MLRPTRVVTNESSIFLRKIAEIHTWRLIGSIFWQNLGIAVVLLTLRFNLGLFDVETIGVFDADVLLAIIFLGNASLLGFLEYNTLQGTSLDQIVD